MVKGKRREEKIRELRERGMSLTAAGRHGDAARVYQELGKLEPQDGDWARREADCHLHLRDDRARLECCARAARLFADGGHLLKAIAMNKIALSIDEGHEASARHLAELYSKRRLVGGQRTPTGPERPPQTGGPESPTRPVAGDRQQPSGTGEDPESRRAQKARARRAAVLALRQIRAQRTAVAELFDAASSPPEQESRAPLSVPGLSPGESPDVAQKAPSLPPELLEPTPSSRPSTRGLSLQALSLHEHLPTESQRLVSDSLPAHRLELPGAAEASAVASSRPAGSAPTPDTPEPTPPSDGDMREPSRGPRSSDAPGLDLDESAFARVPLFSDLDEETLFALISEVTLVELAEDEVLFEEGTLADCLYVVAEGTVVAEAKLEDGERVEWARLGEGEFFGEIGLLSDQPRQASVRALAPTRLLRLERDSLERLTRQNQAFLAALMGFLRERLVDDLMLTSPLFEHFDELQRRELAAKFAFLELDPGTLLLTPGERSSGMHVLLSGEALEFRPQAAKAQLRRLNPGAIFGERALLLGRVSDCEVRTTSRCFSLFLEEKALREVIMTHPQVLEALSQDLDETSDPAGPTREHLTLF